MSLSKINDIDFMFNLFEEFEPRYYVVRNVQKTYEKYATTTHAADCERTIITYLSEKEFCCHE